MASPCPQTPPTEALVSLVAMAYHYSLRECLWPGKKSTLSAGVIEGSSRHQEDQTSGFGELCYCQWKQETHHLCKAPIKDLETCRVLLFVFLTIWHMRCPCIAFFDRFVVPKGIHRSVVKATAKTCSMRCVLLFVCLNCVYIYISP